MKKKTKKLLSSVTAGLFVLQSIPFIAIGSSAVGDTALKYTPTIDGQLDSAYLESYSLELNNSNPTYPVGGAATDNEVSGTAYYLWDDNYIYMAATIKDTAITDASGDLVWQDNVALTFFNSKDGKGDWTMARDARIVISPTAGKIQFTNNNGDGAASNLPKTEAAITEYAEECAYTIDNDNNTYTVEVRVKMDTLAEGDYYQLNFGVMDKYSSAAEDSRFFGSWAWGVPVDGVLSLGAAYEGGDDTPDESTIVKKYTPALDGEMDEQYKYSASLNTIDFATSGKITVGMPFMSDAKVEAWKTAGIADFDEDKNITALHSDGDYSVADFPKGEIYFLWDDDAIYVFSKIYDNEIMTLTADQTAAIVGDWPWLMDSITNIINPESNIFAEIDAYGLASGTAIWDHKSDSNWSTLGHFANDDAAKRLEDAENIATTVNNDEGYYTIEMRIPISEQDFGGTPLKNSFLQDGKTFLYQFRITDSHGGGMQTGSSPKAGYFYQNMNNAVEFTLSAEEPVIPPTPVRFGTPTLDGVIDDAYFDSASLNTKALAIEGMVKTEWPADPDSATKNALIEAGIISSEFVEGDTLLTDGDYSIPEISYAEIYFLWDNDALYVCSKIYDNDIMAIDADTTAAIGTDWPWLIDGIRHDILPDENIYAPMNIAGIASGTAIWDHSANGWSTLGNFANSDAAKRLEDAENIAATVNTDEGYYIVEMRIPISDKAFGIDGADGPLNEYLLKDGMTFGYNFRLTDSDGAWQTAVQAKKQIVYAGTETSVFTLSSEVASTDHVWADDYTVDTEATCTAKGSESIHCTHCDAIKEDSVREIDMIPHSYVDGVCEVCGAPDPDADPCKDGHTWAEEYTIDTPATCTAVGSESIHCTVCGAIKEDSVREIPMTEHSWNEEYTVDKEATCTETGSESIHCSVCGAIKEDSVREIEKIPHNFVDGICTVCGEEEQLTTLGDVNGDGSVDARDLSALMKLLADDSEDTVGDINGDGSVDARDLSALMKLLAEQE